MVGDFPDLSSTASDVELFTSGEEILDDVPEPPISNTGIDALYTSTGLPKKQNNPPIVRKSNFAPYGSKPKAVPPTPFGRYQPGGPAAKNQADETSEAPKQSFSPFGNKPKAVPHNKYTGGFAPVPKTSPLYGGGGGSASASDDKSSNKVEDSTPGQPPKEIPGSVLKYHGLAILNNTKFPTWDSYFEQLLDQPKALLLIESFNPAFPDIELDIDPAALCRRMISVRTQIAKEFEHDLQVIADMGGKGTIVVLLYII